jgi:hypothetical protein
MISFKVEKKKFIFKGISKGWKNLRECFGSVFIRVTKSIQNILELK